MIRRQYVIRYTYVIAYPVHSRTESTSSVDYLLKQRTKRRYTRTMCPCWSSRSLRGTLKCEDKDRCNKINEFVRVVRRGESIRSWRLQVDRLKIHEKFWVEGHREDTSKRTLGVSPSRRIRKVVQSVLEVCLKKMLLYVNRLMYWQGVTYS